MVSGRIIMKGIILTGSLFKKHQGQDLSREGKQTLNG